MLIPQQKNGVMSPLSERLNDSAKEIFNNIFASNTNKAYNEDLKDFYKYLSYHNTNPSNATSETIINYLDCLRRGDFDYNPDIRKKSPRKYSTIQRRLVSIRFLYKQYGEKVTIEAKADNPDFVYHNPASTDQVKNWMKGLRKTIGVAPKTKRAATKTIMNAMINEIQGERLIDIRNRAILAIGYAGALRRSEITALNIEDIRQDGDGLYILLRKSKTDQEGKGHEKFIYYGDQARYCPVRLLDKWIKAAGIDNGALFRRITKGGHLGNRISDQSIYDIIRSTVHKAGFDKSEFGGHSLRRGLITQLADDGVEERDIMRHTGHKSTVTMRRYIEEVDVKKKSPTKGIL